MLGGTVTVESQQGQGSTFSALIGTGPLEGVRLLERPEELHVQDHCDNPQQSTLPIELDCRVLLVEDGPDNQRLISFLLQRAGADVVVADNGQVGVKKALDAGPFDLILMDMQMPVMDGYNATRHLREVQYDGPIVALTANAMLQDERKCIDAGCDAYLTKPIDRRKLLETVQRYSAVRDLIR